MAKVQLRIDTSANLEGLQKAHDSLQTLKTSANGVTQTFRNTRDIDGYKALISRAFHEAGLSGKNFQQSVTAAAGATRKAMKEIQAAVGSGESIKIYGKEGLKADEKNLSTILQQLRSVYDEVIESNKKMTVVPTTDDKVYSYDTFTKDLQQNSQGLVAFGTELEVVNYKIAEIKKQGMILVDTGASEEEIKRLQKDLAGLTAEQKRLADATNGTGTRIKNLIKNFVSAQLIVYALRSAFRLLVNGLKGASQAAAEAEQVMQKFMTVFDGMSSATQSVEDLSTKFGLAKSSAMDIMATIGDMAIGLGATDAEASQFADTTSKFIQDLMAFKDISGDVVEISKAFMSGVAGNTRNFRQWGSIVKESTVTANLHAKGLDKLTGQELEWAKAQERTRIVMEQQKNAMGATQREWDQLITVNRRYTEQVKQLNESVGEQVNKFFLPVKNWLLEQIELWNKATQAKKNYLGKELVMSPLLDVTTDKGRKEAQKALRKDLAGMPGTATVGRTTYGVSVQNITDLADMYGISAVDVMDLVKTQKVDEAFMQALRDHDKTMTEAKASVLQTQVTVEAIEAYRQSLSKTIEGISGLVGIAPSESVLKMFDLEGLDKGILGWAAGYLKVDPSDILPETEAWVAAYGQIGSIVSQLLGKETTGFMDPFDVEIGTGLEAGLKEKQDQIRVVYGALHNAALTATDKDFKGALESIMAKLVEEYKLTADEIEALTRKDFLGFDQQNKSLKEQLQLQRMRTDLLAVYGDENEDIVGILVQQQQAIMATYDIKQQAIDAGWDEVKAEEARLGTQKQILEIYQEQRAEREKLKAIEASEAVQSAIEAAGASIAEVKRERSLVGATDAQRLQAEIDEKVWLYAETLTKGNATLSTTLQMTNEYRKELEMLAADEAAQAVIDAAIAAAKSTKEKVKDKFLAQTDYDLVKDIMDAFKEGGIWGGIFAIIGELVQYMDSFGEVLHIVSGFFEYIGPWLDQVAKPMLPVIEMIFSLLADLFVPILVQLFPIIQVVATVLIYLMAVIKTVTNTISWMGESIETFVWNLFHPLRKRAYRDLGNETKEIWGDATDKVKEIWALELDTRHDFVSALSDAQKAEINAYEEMYKKGLLSLTEKEAMIGKNIFGKNWDTVELTSFGTGGDFVTNGERIIRVGEMGPERVTITPLSSPKYAERYSRSGGGNTSYTVVVNGANADPEAIALAVRREFRIMERRGVRYA